MSLPDPFQARDTLKTGRGEVAIYRLDALEKAGLCRLARLPYTIRIMLEAVLRHAGNGIVVEEDVLPEQGTPLESARRNRAFLRNLGL